MSNSKVQKTLFKTWGTKQQQERDSRNADAGPSSPLRSRTAGNIVTEPQVMEEEEEEFKFEDDFLDDDATEALLLQACVDFTDETDQPSSSTKHLKQNTIPFHIGPSAATHSILNSSIIQEDIPGFDLEAGEKLIYPTNYPVRDYQYNIVRKAIFINTLISLPTGLGKTFIAAVVMYNFYRWYPNGKIVFLAPTKPLVAQQIEACYSVMGISQDDMAEMTGSMPPKDRVLIWKRKRVFFLTPQVMQNDLSRGTCPAQDVNCVVFDEAHKALGNHAYCQVIKALAVTEGHYRVLALSATPGNDLKAVQQVVTNLQIGHIELRSEDSFDIQQYVHQRKVEKIVVPLEGEILDIKNRFLKVLSGVLERLTKYGVLYHSSPERMSKYQLLSAKDKFSSAEPPTGVMAGAVRGDFALAISLFHAFELLLIHGMRSFHQFLKNTFSAATNQSRARQNIIRSPLFNGIMKELHKNLQESKFSPDGPTGGGMGQPRFPITGRGESATDGTEVPGFFYSHPKLQKLEEVVLEHFRSFQDSPSVGSSVETRVMIFSQYRESVQEIADMLGQHHPLIRVMTFVGHSTGKSSSKGLTQKEQTEIVRKFREGGYNTLVATCVGEEGLDIGEVDLIICFDAARSPIRLVQRMGRTGRKRSGKIVVIVSEGKEDQIYNKSQSSKTSIHKAIKEGCKKLIFYQKSPRMVPRQVKPQVHKMHMTVGDFVSAEKKLRRTAKSTGGQSKFGVGFAGGKKGAKNAFLSDQELTCWSKELSLSDREFRVIEKSVGRCVSTDNPLLCFKHLNVAPSSQSERSQADLEHLYVHTQPKKSSGNNSSVLSSRFSLDLSKWVHLQTAPASAKLVGHSSTSEVLRSSLEFAEILQTSDGKSLAYDLEMQKFLDEGDVKKRDRGSKDSNKTGEQRRRKIFLDSSDDEDFVVTSKLSLKTVDDHDNNEDEIACPSDDDEPNDEVSGGEESRKRGVHFTASQHVVPRAPHEDEPLDWLDDIEPSQSQPHFTSTESDKSNIPKKDCEPTFVTPKAPPCKRRNKIFPASCSTPKCAVKTPVLSPEYEVPPPLPSSTTRRNSFMESIDLFADMSARDLFGEFSNSSLLDRESKSQGCSSRDEKTSDPLDAILEENERIKSPASCGAEGHDKSKDRIIIQDDVIVINESDVQEDESSDRTPEVKTSPGVAERESAELAGNDDSYELHPSKRRRKKVNILESPHEERISLRRGNRTNASEKHTPQVPPKRMNKVANATNLDSSDDDFCVPLLKRIRKNTGSKHHDGNYKEKPAAETSPRNPKQKCDFIEDEAQLSGEEDSYLSNDMDAQDIYDVEDSFINDNSMLTQYVQTQKSVSKKNPKSSKVEGDMYMQSLLSPKDKIFSRKKCEASRGKYRMVFSQRYKILNHYMKGGQKSIGDDDDDDDGACRKNQSRRHQEDTSIDGSEAEEVDVAFGEEDAEELSQSMELSQSLSDHHSEKDLDVISPATLEDTYDDVAVIRKGKRRAVAFLSDSEEMDKSHHETATTSNALEPETEKRKAPSHTPAEFESQHSSRDLDSMRTVDISQFSNILISPSLLERVKHTTVTPPGFSIGMDDWITDIDYEHKDNQERTDICDEQFQDINDSFFDDDIDF